MQERLVCNLALGFVWFAQLLFHAPPWLRWGERQALMFDLEAQRFYIFGLLLYGCAPAQTDDAPEEHAPKESATPCDICSSPISVAPPASCPASFSRRLS